jgi:putative CocE/NonD family hydrolase
MAPDQLPVLRDQAVTMRDGATLYADVHLPAGHGPFPALLERTPYSKDNSPEAMVGAPAFFGAQGYAVVVQDVRGRFMSEGAFAPFQDDGWGANRDGADTVEWIAAQPWCNAAVGTIGGSYAGATQYLLAPTRPPHLRAMAVREASADFHGEWVYHGGAFELAFMLGWTMEWAAKNLAHSATGAEYARRKGRLDKANAEIESWQRQLPLGPNPLLSGVEDWYNDYLAHPDDGPFWWQWNIEQQHAEIETPMLHLGGWFDIFLNGTLRNFTGLRAHARTAAARRAQRLVVGPWIHAPWNMPKPVQGEVDFGPEAARDYNTMRLPWFDYWLKGQANGLMDEPAVQLFVMGENKWRTADDYPWPGARETAWYLHEGGRLEAAAPSEPEQPDSYRYDPDDPVPTRGGNLLYLPGGPFDQRPIEGRCLTYTSEPLAQDLTIIGGVRCVLYGLSSAPDTDWVVRLTDVHPDGFSRLLCDGILRARYRASSAAPTLLNPNQIYEFVVDLWATANTFLAGHRIRVAITSSSFPRFDRNLNTGGLSATDTARQVAYNTVFHDPRRMSHIILPVVD